MEVNDFRKDFTRARWVVTQGFLLIPLLAVLLSGCGGNGGGSIPTLTIQSGNWAFSGTSTSAPGNTFTAGGNLTQNGSVISGITHINATSGCFDFTTDIPVSGSVNGQTMTVSSAPVAGQTISITASGSATALTGNYTISGGCAETETGAL